MKIAQQAISKLSLNLKITKASEELASNFKTSYASSDFLKGLLPDIDKKANPDLLSISFNSAVANLINGNDDGMLTPQVKIVTPTFKYKPINVEHYRYQPIGCVLNYGFSDFGSETEMTDISDEFKGPFNIALGGLLWKSVDSWTVERVEECANENDRYCYQELSASWEVGFDEFVIALGSKKIADAEIITDDDKVKELMKYLRAEGGPGFMDDGTPVYRLITGNPVALGIGITSIPAAQVKGITVASLDQLKKMEQNLTKEEFQSVIASLNDNINKISEKTDKFISLSTKSSVNRNRMKIKDIEDINDEVLKEAKASASDIQLFFREEMDKANKKFIEERDAQKTQKETAEKEALAAKAEVQEAKTKTSELETKVVELSAKITEFEKEKTALAHKVTFDGRVSEIEGIYNLDENLKKIVASQIENLDDAGFKTWKDNFAVLGAAFKKTPEQKEAKASLFNSPKPKATIPNTSSSEESSAKSGRNIFLKADKAE